MGKKKACYAVWRGRVPGIYETWEETKAQTEGYSNNGYKGCGTRQEAEDLMQRYYTPGSSQPLVSCLPGTFPRTRSRSPETENDNTQPSRSPSPTLSQPRVSTASATINSQYKSETSEAQTVAENAHATSPAAATTSRPTRDNMNGQPSAGKVRTRRRQQQHQQRAAQQQQKLVPGGLVCTAVVLSRLVAAQNNHHNHVASDLDKALSQLSI